MGLHCAVEETCALEERRTVRPVAHQTVQPANKLLEPRKAVLASHLGRIVLEHLVA